MTDDMIKVIDDALEQHKKIFGDELSLGELNHVLSGIREHKRRQWLQGRLVDFEVPELDQLLNIVDERAGRAEGEQA